MVQVRCNFYRNETHHIEIIEQKPYLLTELRNNIVMDMLKTVQDLFHVFLNNFEMAIILLFFKLFIIFFLHYISAIFKKWETRPRGGEVSAPDLGSQVRIPLEARFYPNLKDASLHRAFHVHPSIVSK